MSDTSHRHALFEGLVFNEQGEPAAVACVGSEPFYVVLDAGFRRYVESALIDGQVLAWLREQILSNEELVSQGTMSVLGRDDLFTKAMIDASIKDFDKHTEQLVYQGFPEEVRAWLGLLGFRVVVDVHGEVIEIEGPAVADTDDW